MDEIGDTLAGLFPRLAEYAARHGISICGQPFTRYGASQADGSIEIEACMPVESMTEGAGSIRCVEIEACTAATVTHYGEYDKLGDAHFALGEFVRRNGLETAGLVWEEYLNDPGAEPDSSKWRTLVCWPVKPEG
jgi:effector-binding domain-containing protein